MLTDPHIKGNLWPFCTYIFFKRLKINYRSSQLKNVEKYLQIKSSKKQKEENYKDNTIENNDTIRQVYKG